MKLRYFSTFSGAEGIGMGLPEDWECVGFSEFDKYASDVLRYHYPDIQNHGNIQLIDWTRVPDFDVLIGGSPCQDLSIAGKRAGLGGSRSSLFFEYVRALREKKPSYFLWENVKGALSSQDGWDLATVQIELAESGYVLWQHLLNAKHHGVPQNRERILIIGSRTGSLPEILFVPQNHSGYNSQIEDEEQISKSITTRSERCDPTAQTYIANALTGKQSPPSRTQRRAHENYIATTLGTRGGSRGNIEATYIADTLKARQDSGIDDKHPQTLIADLGIRRLTPLESERVMSWPDNRTKYGRASIELVRYKKSGNIEICNTGKIKTINSPYALWTVVREKGKPILVTVSCTTNDGKGVVPQQSNKTLKEKTNVNIVIEKSAQTEHWECAINITRCNDSMEILSILKGSVQIPVAADISERQMEPTDIEESLKDISGANLSPKKLSTILTAINSITKSLISTFAHAESIVCSIQNSNLSINKDSEWTVLSLKMDTIYELSDAARYKIIGNGVATKMIKEVSAKMFPQ